MAKAKEAIDTEALAKLCEAYAEELDAQHSDEGGRSPAGDVARECAARVRAAA